MPPKWDPFFGPPVLAGQGGKTWAPVTPGAAPGAVALPFQTMNRTTPRAPDRAPGDRASLLAYATVAGSPSP